MGLQPTERKSELRHYIYTKSADEICVTPEEYQELREVLSAKDSTTKLFGVFVSRPDTDDENIIPMSSIDHIGKKVEEV